MADVRIWAGVTVSVQSALAAAKTVSGITKADPGVVTHATGAQTTGAYITMDVEGMTQIDERVFRVASPTANTLQLEGEDTSGYSTFSSGSFQAITFGNSLTTATNVTASGGDPQFANTTTIHQLQQTQIPTTTSPATFSFESIWDPFDAGLTALKAASDARAKRAMKFTFSDGAIMVFTGYVSATLLPTGQAGDIVKCNVTITMFGLPTYYAS